MSQTLLGLITAYKEFFWVLYVTRGLQGLWIRSVGFRVTCQNRGLVLVGWFPFVSQLEMSF